MCISHLLSINFWFIITLQTTGLLITEPPHKPFLPVSFLWTHEKNPKCQKNGDLEISHLYFKVFLQSTCCPSNLGSYCLAEDRFLWFHHVTKLKKRKRETSNENSPFHYSNMWITLSCSQAMGLTHSVLQHLFKSFSAAILHFH